MASQKCFFAGDGGPFIKVSVNRNKGVLIGTLGVRRRIDVKAKIGGGGGTASIEMKAVDVFVRANDPPEVVDTIDTSCNGCGKLSRKLIHAKFTPTIKEPGKFAQAVRVIATHGTRRREVVVCRGTRSPEALEKLSDHFGLVPNPDCSNAT